MKIKYLFFPLVFISLICSAQQNEKTVKINTYRNTLKEYQKNKAYKEIHAMDDKDFKVIVKETYEAIEIAPDELNDIIEQDHFSWTEEIKGDRNLMYNKVKYGIVQRIIFDEIKKRYSEIIYFLTRIPIFIKAKVLSISEGSDSAGFSKIVIKLEPEQIIKGKVAFINDEEFEVYLNCTLKIRHQDKQLSDY